MLERCREIAKETKGPLNPVQGQGLINDGAHALNRARALILLGKSDEAAPCLKAARRALTESNRLAEFEKILIKAEKEALLRGDASLDGQTF